VHPAKAVGRNEIPFGRDTREAPSNIVLDGGSGPPHGKGRFGGRNPQLPQSVSRRKHLYKYSLDVSSCVAAIPPIAKLLWPLLEIVGENFSHA